MHIIQLVCIQLLLNEMVSEIMADWRGSWSMYRNSLASSYPFGTLVCVFLREYDVISNDNDVIKFN